MNFRSDLHRLVILESLATQIRQPAPPACTLVLIFMVLAAAAAAADGRAASMNLGLDLHGLSSFEGCTEWLRRAIQRPQPPPPTAAPPA
ncbi:MAG: hypothetical protein R3B48_15935 [Kofleriaceae bacterium]